MRNDNGLNYIHSTSEGTRLVSTYQNNEKSASYLLLSFLVSVAFAINRLYLYFVETRVCTYAKARSTPPPSYLI